MVETWKFCVRIIWDYWRDNEYANWIAVLV